VPESRSRAAIVTGGGTGIGRDITRVLSETGVNCVITGRRAHRLEETVDACRGGPGVVRSVPGDITDEHARRRVVAECVDQFGGIDILVNNAGVSNWSALLDYSVEEWREVISTNLEAPFFLAQAVIPQMRQQQWGRIINIGSVYGQVALNNKYYGERLPMSTPRDRGPVRAVAYAASKGGLVSLTRELAVAVASWNITVNVVVVGMVGSERGASDPAGRKQLEAMTPVGRFGELHEISAIIPFLASDEAAFITGAELVVDGGWTAW
jgi:NAD(P)-dependent dehydrogenase (short-subunit alcohol dehydrogenase family)